MPPSNPTLKAFGKRPIVKLSSASRAQPSTSKPTSKRKRSGGDDDEADDLFAAAKRARVRNDNDEDDEDGDEDNANDVTASLAELARSRTLDEHEDEDDDNNDNDETASLAERARPRTLDDVCGHSPLLAPRGKLRLFLAAGRRMRSLILWGPPGTGKTTLARLVAPLVAPDTLMVELSAESGDASVPVLRKLLGDVGRELDETGRRTVVVVDAVHKLPSQQQAMLQDPIESGAVVLVGTTTEDPRGKLSDRLWSRCSIFALDPLSSEAIETILDEALDRKLCRTARGEGLARQRPALLTARFLAKLARAAAGDARVALKLLEQAFSTASQHPDMSKAELEQSLDDSFLHGGSGGKAEDMELLGALEKCILAGDANAALFYLGVLVSDNRADAHPIARRLIVVASADVKLTTISNSSSNSSSSSSSSSSSNDHQMLQLAIATHDAVGKVGLPEAHYSLARCVIALASAKLRPVVRNAVVAVRDALAREGGPAAVREVPAHLRERGMRSAPASGYHYHHKHGYNGDSRSSSKSNLPRALRGREFIKMRTRI